MKFARLVLNSALDAPFELLSIIAARSNARERKQLEQFTSRIQAADLNTDIKHFGRQ